MSARMILMAATLLVQGGIAAHGWERWHDRATGPLLVSVGSLAIREGTDGSWHASDLARADRMQITLESKEPVQVTVIRVRAGENGVTRLSPSPGETAPVLHGRAWYALPSPSTWYDVTTLAPGDRVLLVAMRAAQGAPSAATQMKTALLGPLSAEEIRSTRSRADATRGTGRTESVELPLPDGGHALVDLTQWTGADSVWVEWTMPAR
jgi:hypothetical protein